MSKSEHLIDEISQESKKLGDDIDTILHELRKVIIGQDGVLERLLMAMVSNGHVLLEGVPGLAKTLMIKTLAQTVHASFNRIQFTPDLLPADILGTKIYNLKTGTFDTKKGPIFANFLLADEINRAPPKVQSALLEAMQERQATIAGETYRLPSPFLVLATQNPIETEGTYILPEAQVDRFMFKIKIDYPDQASEIEIVKRMDTTSIPVPEKVVELDDIMKMQEFKDRIYVDDTILKYITNIVKATRRPEEFGLDIKRYVEFGASPRASIWMSIAGKVHAILDGRGYVTPWDIKSIAPDVLRHRVILTFEAEAEDITPDMIVDDIIHSVEIP